jgi:hypothetical protein
MVTTDLVAEGVLGEEPTVDSAPEEGLAEVGVLDGFDELQAVISTPRATRPTTQNFRDFIFPPDVYIQRRSHLPR